MPSSYREMNLFEIVKIQEIKEKNNIRDYKLIDFTTGFDRCVYLLFSKRPPDRIKIGGGCFVDTKADTEYAATRIVVDWSQSIIVHTEFYDLGMYGFNYHFIRPIKKDILLVGARCTYFNENDFEDKKIAIKANGEEAKISQFSFSGSKLLFLTEDGVLRGNYFFNMQ